jgi:hypothetical protein
MLHIANMHASYDDNQARFHRDYIGRQFSANLPIRQISESVFGSDTLVISLGSGTNKQRIGFVRRQGGDFGMGLKVRGCLFGFQCKRSRRRGIRRACLHHKTIQALPRQAAADEHSPQVANCQLSRGGA